MKTELICVEKNAFCGEKTYCLQNTVKNYLYEKGYELFKTTSVNEVREDVVSVLANAIKKSKMIIFCADEKGITKKSVCEALGISLEEKAEVYNDLKQRFSDKLTENEIKDLSLFPTKAVLFRNEKGAGYGFAVNSVSQHIVFLPDKENEVSEMLELSANDYMSLYSNDDNKFMTVLIYDVDKENTEKELRKILKTDNFSISSQNGLLTAKIFLKKGEITETERAIRIIVKKFGANVVGTDISGIEESVVPLLKKNGLTVSVAESCTGGLVAKKITDVSGASEIFAFSEVTYSEKFKMSELGVSEECLKINTVVSEQTAEMMALGILEKSGADIGLSVTGVAGPESDSYGNPVGLVYCSLTNGEKVWTERFSFGEKTRDEIRCIASNALLNMLRLYLLALPYSQKGGKKVPKKPAEIPQPRITFGKINNIEAEETKEVEEIVVNVKKNTVFEDAENSTDIVEEKKKSETSDKKEKDKTQKDKKEKDKTQKDKTVFEQAVFENIGTAEPIFIETHTPDEEIPPTTMDTEPINYDLKFL